jgi:hypothetical protein
MSDDFASILDAHWEHRQAGQHPDDESPALSPEQTEELAVLLDLAAQVGGLPAPAERAGAVEDGRRRMLAAVRAQVPTPPRLRTRFTQQAAGIISMLTGLWSRPAPALRLAVGACIALVLVTHFAVVASASSLPGDALYPVKLTWEQTLVTLTPQAERRAELESQFDAVRRQEVEMLVQQGREATTQIAGTLTQRPNGWAVGEVRVGVSAATRIDGKLVDGALARAQVRTAKNGSVSADWIEVIHRAPTHLEAPPREAPSSTTAQPAATSVPKRAHETDAHATPTRLPAAAAPVTPPAITAATATPVRTDDLDTTPHGNKQGPAATAQARPTHTPQPAMKATPSTRQQPGPKVTPNGGNNGNSGGQQNGTPPGQQKKQAKPTPTPHPKGH